MLFRSVSQSRYETFVPIKKDDLEGNIDIEITISTAEDNASKAQELSFLLQTLGNSIPFDMTKIVMAKMAKLHRMPDLEKQLLEFEPPKDPAQEEMKQMEIQRMRLELAKLESEIERNNARAGEDMVDVEVKQAKAAVEKAKARKLHSDADMTDLMFLQKDAGLPEQEKAQAHANTLQLADHKRLAKLDEIAYNAVVAPKDFNGTK